MDKEIFFRVKELEEALEKLINSIESTTYESGGDRYVDESTDAVVVKSIWLEAKKALRG